MTTKRRSSLKGKEFCEGMTFDNFADFNTAFDVFQKIHGMNLKIKSSCYIVDVIPKEGKTFNEELMFYYLDFLCKGGHMKTERTGKGGGNRPHFVECTYQVKIGTTDDGQKLFVKSMDSLAVHNHKINKVLNIPVPLSGGRVSFFRSPAAVPHVVQQQQQQKKKKNTYYQVNVGASTSSSNPPTSSSNSNLLALPAPPTAPFVSPVKVRVDGAEVKTKETRSKRQLKQDALFVYQPMKKRRNKKNSDANAGKELNSISANVTSNTSSGDGSSAPTPGVRRSRRQIEKKAAEEEEAAVEPETPETTVENTGAIDPPVELDSGAVINHEAAQSWDEMVNVITNLHAPLRRSRVNPGRFRQSAFATTNILYDPSPMTDDAQFVDDTAHLEDINANDLDLTDANSKLLNIEAEEKPQTEQPKIEKIKLTKMKKMKSKGVQCTPPPDTRDMSTQTDPEFTNAEKAKETTELYIKVLTERFRAIGSKEAAFKTFLALGKIIADYPVAK